MIPPVIPQEGISPGEIQVFEWLRVAPGTEEWVVFHSYDLPKGRVGRRHEVDFIIMIPNLGIAIVEVKGHRAATVNDRGQWRLGASPSLLVIRSSRFLMPVIPSKGTWKVGHPRG
jgi:hypothetical protein